MKAIIVLGSRIIKNPFSGIYEPSNMLRMRLDKCYDEFIAHYDDHTIIVVSGGQPHGEPISEAEVMKRYLISRDITACKIFEENTSNNTIENSINSYELLNKLYKKKLTLQELHPNPTHCGLMGCIPRFKSVKLITSDFHMPRSRNIFEEHNNDDLLLSFVSAPTPFDIPHSYLENENMFCPL